MTHHCPECQPQGNAAEDYKCDRCKDVYCVHFMKIIKGPTMIEPPKMEPGYPRAKVVVPGRWTPGEHLCWVCGSEKKGNDVVGIV